MHSMVMILLKVDRSQAENIKAVLDDIMEGNDGALLPGQIEAESAQRSAKNAGLVFSTAEITAFNEIASECNQPAWDIANLKVAV